MWHGKAQLLMKHLFNFLFLDLVIFQDNYIKYRCRPSGKFQMLCKSELRTVFHFGFALSCVCVRLRICASAHIWTCLYVWMHMCVYECTCVVLGGTYGLAHGARTLPRNYILGHCLNFVKLYVGFTNACIKNVMLFSRNVFICKKIQRFHAVL